MCTCLKDIEGKIIEKYPQYNKKNVLDVSGDAVFLFGDGGISGKKTYTDFDLELEGQKKKVSVQVNHTFCPWCSVKYE